MTLDEVTASWLRAKLSKKKRRATPRLHSPRFLQGQLRLPKPTRAQMIAEQEEEAARRIYNAGKVSGGGA